MAETYEVKDGVGVVKATVEQTVFQFKSVAEIDGLIGQYTNSITKLQAEIVKLQTVKTELIKKGLKAKE